MTSTLQESAEFKAFMQRVGEKAAEYQMMLRSTREPYVLYHAQGALQMADYVHELPEIMRQEAEQQTNDDADEQY